MYTNGFHKTQVLSALVGRLGWSNDILNATNQTSRSGRYFDDSSFHNLVTVENIQATAPSVDDWDEFFIAKQNAVVLKCLNAVFNCPEFFENSVTLYERTSNVETSVTNASKFVGYEIRVASQSDLAVQINSATLYFDGAETFNLYLFKDGKVAPLKTIEVTTVADNYTEVLFDGNDQMILKYPGKYYLGYFQDDLGIVKAIQENVCYKTTYKFSARAIEATQNGADFTRDGISYTSQPGGINLNVSSFKDFTSQIVNQPHLFDEALGMVMAASVLEGIIYGLRSNATDTQLKEAVNHGLQYELLGAAPVPDSPQIMGIKSKAEKELRKVKESFYPKSKAQVVNYAG